MPAKRKGTAAIDKSLEEVTYKDRDGYPYIIHPLMDGVPRVDPELLREWVDWAKDQDILEGATVLLAPEAMGIPLAVTLGMETGLPFVVARKREYGLDGEMMAYCETGYGSTCIYINDITPEDRVVITEDVISTGSTLTAIINTVKSIGAHVGGVLCPVSKGDGADRVRNATNVPVCVMKHLDFDDDGGISVD